MDLLKGFLFAFESFPLIGTGSLIIIGICMTTFLASCLWGFMRGALKCALLSMVMIVLTIVLIMTASLFQGYVLNLGGGGGGGGGNSSCIGSWILQNNKNASDLDPLLKNVSCLYESGLMFAVSAGYQARHFFADALIRLNQNPMVRSIYEHSKKEVDNILRKGIVILLDLLIRISSSNEDVGSHNETVFDVLFSLKKQAKAP